MFYSVLSCTECSWWTLLAGRPGGRPCERCAGAVTVTVYVKSSVTLPSGETLVHLRAVSTDGDKVTNGLSTLPPARIPPDSKLAPPEGERHAYLRGAEPNGCVLIDLHLATPATDLRSEDVRRLDAQVRARADLGTTRGRRHQGNGRRVDRRVNKVVLSARVFGRNAGEAKVDIWP